MLKSNRFLISAMVVLSIILGAWTVQVNRTDTEQEQIIDSVESYFETRYRTFSNLKMGDFEVFVDKSSHGEDFLRSELDKLSIEVYHAKLNHLRYVEYKFFLEFKKIAIDAESQTATVSVVEGHDVVFEITAPTVSSMRNLHHTIFMRKENGSWKIVTDDYEDYLWRLIKTTKQSKDELLRLIDESLSLNGDTPQESDINSQMFVQSNNVTFPYDRNGAVDYAHEWATAPRPYNPDYDDFTDIGSEYGGDCTNFVSQAIHEGGGAPMQFYNECGNNCVGTNGWFYTDMEHRAAAWVWVDRLHSFIVNEHYPWPTGPEGHEVGKDYAYEGDVIQYNWDNDSIWDHTVIIVRSDDMGYGDMNHMVASHTPDIDNYPFSFFNYNSIRFIHIDRIDAVDVYLPLVIKGEGAGASSMPTPHTNPYPAPVENNEASPIQPYPAP